MFDWEDEWIDPFLLIDDDALADRQRGAEPRGGRTPTPGAAALFWGVYVGMWVLAAALYLAGSILAR